MIRYENKDTHTKTENIARQDDTQANTKNKPAGPGLDVLSLFAPVVAGRGGVKGEI